MGNSTAVIDILARNGFEPSTCYMENVRAMEPGSGHRMVARAVTCRFVPARADSMAEKPSGEESPEYAAFEMAGPGDVIVMEAMKTKLMSVGGDIKFLRLKQQGIEGLCAFSRWTQSLAPTCNHLQSLARACAHGLCCCVTLSLLLVRRGPQSLRRGDP